MDMMKSTMTTAHATPPMCSAMVLKSNCIARPPGLWVCTRRSPLREPEGHDDRHDDRNRHPVQQVRHVHPLLPRFDGGPGERGDAPLAVAPCPLPTATDSAVHARHR